MKLLNEKEYNALLDLSRAINVSPDIIYKMIDAESGWRPLVKNPNGSARGLFQWIDSTARSYGFKSSLDLVEKNPTVYDQLVFAKTYWKKLAPFKNDYEFCLSNFLPAYKKYPAETRIIDLPNGKAIHAANPRLFYLGDYYKMVSSRKIPVGMKFPPLSGNVGLLVPVLLVSLFFSIRIAAEIPVCGKVAEYTNDINKISCAIALGKEKGYECFKRGEGIVVAYNTDKTVGK